jgi:hypothetical protein
MLLHLWAERNQMANSPAGAFVLEPAFAKPTARQALALPNWSLSLPIRAVYRPVICAYRSSIRLWISYL